MPVEIPSRPGKGRPGGDQSLLEQLLNYWFGNLFAALRGDGDGILAGAIDGIHDIFEFFSTKWETVETHSEAIARLEEIAAAFTVTPAYVADIQDMASGARASLIAWNNDGDKYFPTFEPDAGALVSTGEVYYTPIIVDRRGTVDKLRWVVGADSTVFSIDAYYMALMAYNPANGNLEKIWQSANLKNTEADADELDEVEIDMGINQECTPGQLLFVAHQQIAPGLAQRCRSFGAIPQAGVGRPSTLLLDASSYKSPSPWTNAIPSSVPFASLLRNNEYIPWAAVSVVPLAEAP